MAVPFWLAVNVTARELGHPGTTTVVTERAGARAASRPSSSTSRSPSPTLAGDHGPAGAALRRLRAMGVRISIDEATDAWSFHTNGFPVDILKASPETRREVLAHHGGDIDVVAAASRSARRRSRCAAAAAASPRASSTRVRAPAEEIDALLDVLPIAA